MGTYYEQTSMLVTSDRM